MKYFNNPMSCNNMMHKTTLKPFVTLKKVILQDLYFTFTYLYLYFSLLLSVFL